MATIATEEWRSAAPQVKLTVTETSSNSLSATYSWTLILDIDSPPSGVSARPYGAVIDGVTVASGSYNINKAVGEYTLGSGSVTVNRSTSVKSVQFSCYMDFGSMTWSGTTGGYRSASGSFTLSAKPSYTVTYNANGGANPPSSQTKWYGSTLTLSSSKPTRTGYSFKNWNTNSGGTGTSYQPGASYTTNAALTLYAQWGAITYTVSYNANGGTGAPPSQTKTHGVTLTLTSSKPTRTNYNFLGWGVSPTATTVSYVSGGSYTANSGITLYAIWELAYIVPRINNFASYRCDSAGNASESGTYFKVSFNWTTDKTVSSIKVMWKTSSSTSWSSTTLSASGTIGTVSSVIGSGAISTEYSYNVHVVVADSMSNTPVDAIIPSRLYPIDVLNGGRGVSVGKTAEVANRFDSAWPIREQGTDLSSKYMLKSDLLNKIYPVNSIYISYSHTSPASLFGGSWLRIEARFLYATGASGVIGEVGGENSHVLTIDELPKHRHNLYATSPSYKASYNSGGTTVWPWTKSAGGINAGEDGDGSSYAQSMTYVGAGVAHNNNPPFIKVSVWRRTG